MPPLQSPRAGAQCGNRQRGRVIDIERQFGQALAGKGQFLKLVARQLAAAQRFRTDLRLLCQNTRGELVSAHLQAEESNRRAIVEFAAVALPFEMFLRAIEGDVGRQRCLAHARTPSKDDQVRVVQA